MPKETVKRPEPQENPSSEVTLGLSVGWNKLGWVQLYMEPYGAESTGDWYIAELSRAEINRTIRALRKARDQAFGRDE